ncbi:MAG: hypothetical protein ACKVYV_04970 [Limisphaerales bacterium]
MSAVPMEASVGSHVLRSDLAQYCLPQSGQDDTRILAWANALALLFVFIGVLGLRGPIFVIREIPKFEEPAREIIVNADEPPPTQDVTLEETPPDMPEISPMPQVVMAVQNPASVTFAVPAIGPVQIVEHGRYASPAPAAPVRAYQPPALQIKNIRFGGGEFSRQDYDRGKVSQLASRGMKGSYLVTLISIGTDGTIKGVDVERGSGFPEFDSFWVGEIRNKWLAPPGDERKYRLRSDF